MRNRVEFENGVLSVLIPRYVASQSDHSRMHEDYLAGVKAGLATMPAIPTRGLTPATYDDRKASISLIIDDAAFVYDTVADIWATWDLDNVPLSAYAEDKGAWPMSVPSESSPQKA